MLSSVYHGKRVLITGHTGFKGSWLALWLTQMGAKVTGYSLAPPTEPNHFRLLNLNINSVTGDIRDADKLKESWIDGQDVMLALNISKRTLQSLRDSGLLPHSRINGKFYYKVSDLEALLDSNYTTNAKKPEGYED